MRVLFVCTGNTCRSPMLEFAFRHYLLGFGITDIEVDSAGILSRETSVSSHVTGVLKAHSVPYEERKPKFCSAREVMDADIVITMTAEQAELLRGTYACNKIISLADAVGYEIPDPFGQGREAYENTYLLICEALPKLLKYLKNRR